VLIEIGIVSTVAELIYNPEPDPSNRRAVAQKGGRASTLTVTVKLRGCHGLAPWRFTSLPAWWQGYSAISCERETSTGQARGILGPRVGRMWQAP